MTDKAGPTKLVCPKCGDSVRVDSGFNDKFYCHICGVIMVPKK
jgi:ribosomal protein S27AE